MKEPVDIFILSVGQGFGTVSSKPGGNGKATPEIGSGKLKLSSTACLMASSKSQRVTGDPRFNEALTRKLSHKSLSQELLGEELRQVGIAFCSQKAWLVKSDGIGRASLESADGFSFAKKLLSLYVVINSVIIP